MGICRPGSGRPSKLTGAIVDRQMEADDETTATQLHSILCRMGYRISLRTVLRCRTQLGWTFRGSAYCQIVHEANRVKRLEYAQRNKDYNFDDVVFTDECSIQLETHRRFSCHRRGDLPRPKPRYWYNYPVWVGHSIKINGHACYSMVMHAIIVLIHVLYIFYFFFPFFFSSLVGLNIQLKFMSGQV